MTVRGLVLGAGGVLGAAWTIGALAALESERGLSPGDFDTLQGTSAGSVLAALLASGVQVSELLAHEQDQPVHTGPLAQRTFDHAEATGGALPSIPRPGVGSVPLLWRTVRQPRRVHPAAALAALLPQGRRPLDSVSDLIEAVADTWPSRPRTWIVTMDYDTGRRTVFGRDGSPPALLSEAVRASCAIPGWFSPVTISGRRYVDGGTMSSASADTLSALGLDEVWVFAPMASLRPDSPTTTGARAERAFRRSVTRRLLKEAGRLQDAGTTVRLVTPGPDDLAVLGANMMDPSRRREVLEMSLTTSPAAIDSAATVDTIPWAG